MVKDLVGTFSFGIAMILDNNLAIADVIWNIKFIFMHKKLFSSCLLEIAISKFSDKFKATLLWVEYVEKTVRNLWESICFVAF